MAYGGVVGALFELPRPVNELSHRLRAVFAERLQVFLRCRSPGRPKRDAVSRHARRRRPSFVAR